MAGVAVASASVIAEETVATGKALPEQPAAVVPVTVYVLVTAVEEMTEDPVVAFRFVEGDQVNAVPGCEDEAVSVRFPAPQITPEVAVITGVGYTLIVTEFEYSAPVLSVTKYSYVVVVAGLTDRNGLLIVLIPSFH